MKKTIATIILLICLALNVFAQQEIPMFFDSEMGLSTVTTINRSAVYSPDGSKIAITFNNNRRIAIWDATTGREITRLAGHGNNDISDFVFSPNGRQIATCANHDSTVKIWDTTSGTLIRNINQAGVDRISFSPDGSRIVGSYYTNNEGGIKIWNASNGNEIRTLIEHTNYIRSFVYSPDGRQIVIISDDRNFIIWDAGTGQIIRTISVEANLRNVVYSPNGQFIATYDVLNIRNGPFTIRIFNATTGQEIRSIPAQLISGNNFLLYSPDNRQLLVNTIDDNRNTFIKIFDPDTGRELRSFNNGDRAIAFSPNGQRILTASASFRLTIDGNTYGASYATLLDAATGRVTGTIGYGPLNVGARAYADLQIARFLGDTAAVSRHEAVLQFITGRGNATRSEIETFYRNNIRAQIAAVVDREFAGITVPVAIITNVKNSIELFLLRPDQASFENINFIHRRIEMGREQQKAYEDVMFIHGVQEAIVNVYGPNSETGTRAQIAVRDALSTASGIQNNLNTIRRQLNAPNDAPVDWSDLYYAYRRILNGFNTELIRRM